MYMARLAVFLFCPIVVVAVSVCYPLFGPLNVTDFGLPLGQFGRARTTTYAGWMCLNKYAKFATFVRIAAFFFFFVFVILLLLLLLLLLLALALPEAQDLFFRHFVDISARPKREGQWVVFKGRTGQATVQLGQFGRTLTNLLEWRLCCENWTTR